MQGRDMGTQREHLERLAAKGHATAQAELAAHPCPRALRPLWRHFTALSAWRGAGGMGAAPLTLADIDAYERRFGVTFMAGELDLLKRLDFEALTPTTAGA